MDIKYLIKNKYMKCVLQINGFSGPRPRVRSSRRVWGHDRLNDSGEVKVQKQVLMSFSIGKYHDEVLCDVVLMYASHILLGRPWQFDMRANHDGFNNCFIFMKNKKLVTLVPLTPKQVYEDQVKLKQECNSKKIEKEKERK